MTLDDLVDFSEFRVISQIFGGNNG